MPAALNLTGRTFGTLRVLERVPGERDAWGYVVYRCRCKCGHEFIASTKEIRTGTAVHCDKPPRKAKPKKPDGFITRQQAAQERVQRFLCHYPAQAFEP